MIKIVGYLIHGSLLLSTLAIKVQTKKSHFILKI